MATPKNFRSIQVPQAMQGERLDRALTELLKQEIAGGAANTGKKGNPEPLSDAAASRSRVAHWIREGLVMVDRIEVRKPGHPLAGGEKLDLQLPEPVEIEWTAELAPEILYEDEWMGVLAKPAGLAMHGNYPGDPRPSVAKFLAARYGPNLPINQGPERPGVVHRLDRETSGVCIVAFDQEVFIDLQEQFAERSIEKEYRALVYGRPRFQSDWIDRPLARDPKRPDRVKVMRSLGPGVREALTYWEVIERYRGFAYLKVLPKSGRTHQIRVHLASIDLPLVGDPLYRARNYGPGLIPPQAPHIHRTLLHAYSISFEHPHRGEILTFTADLAKDFAALRQFLAKNQPAGSEGWK